MKMSSLALKVFIANACLTGFAFGQSGRQAPRNVPVSYSLHDNGTSAASPSDVAPTTASCDNCSSGCDSGACDSMGGGCGTSLFGLGLFTTDRALDDPWKLCADPCGGLTIGGWTSIGYHSHSNPLSFNTYDGRAQLGQQWFFAEKVADGSQGLGLGGRIDYLYGTDAQDTQSFGIPDNHFDNSWDNTPYGHAMPQLYGEVAMGNLSAKIGRFFTIIGNEVVQATGNFFYSRQFTFYNAEPFTHTGALTTYKIDDDTLLYNGYVLGWDSGFQDNGDAYIGGMKFKVDDTWSVLYTTALGRFGSGNRPVGEQGGIHSVILSGGLTEKLTYINQIDTMYTTNVNNAVQRNTFGNIHYLIYQVNNRVALGQRFEWFNFGGAGFNNVRNDDLYNYTVGINYRAHANLLIRPEVRTVWDRDRFGFNEQNRSSQTAFGGDMVFTF